jgi:hypothetical protein
MAEQRAHWVALGGGLRLRYHRPPEVDMPAFAGGVTLEHAVRYACGWEGFTEATLLGPAVGSADPVPFAAELWDAWLRDNSQHLPAVTKALADSITAHLAARGDVAKNSTPSST